MKVVSIFVSSHFKKQFAVLPKGLQQKAIRAESLFRANPFHPSLRLHKLRGKFENSWSLSVDMKYRIIFKIANEGEILFVNIGKHSIYERNW